jgi:diamine N-acetyltransferase
VSLAQFIKPCGPRQPSLLGGSEDPLYYRPGLELSRIMLPRGCTGSRADISTARGEPFEPGCQNPHTLIFGTWFYSVGVSSDNSMMTGFSIRHCTAADASTLSALSARLFTETYGPTHPEPELSRYLARSFAVEGIRIALGEDGVAMLIAENPEGGAIAYAYVRASPDPPAGVSGGRVFEIVRFYVDGAFQGRGVGAALMQQCLDETKRRGADGVWLQVWKEAPWAIGFYERMGFAVVGSAKFYFGEQIGDDHVMAKSLRSN